MTQPVCFLLLLSSLASTVESQSPSEDPTPAPTSEKCFICLDAGNAVTLPDVVIEVNGAFITCGDAEDAGLGGDIPPDFCPLVQEPALASCGCAPVLGSESPSVSPANTAVPPSPSRFPTPSETPSMSALPLSTDSETPSVFPNLSESESPSFPLLTDSESPTGFPTLEPTSTSTTLEPTVSSKPAVQEEVPATDPPTPPSSGAVPTTTTTTTAAPTSLPPPSSSPSSAPVRFVDTPAPTRSGASMTNQSSSPVALLGFALAAWIFFSG